MAQHATAVRQSAASDNALAEHVAAQLPKIALSKQFVDWAVLFARVWNGDFRLPSKQLYDLLKACPNDLVGNDRNLKDEMLANYRKYRVLKDGENVHIDAIVRRLATFLQMANFVSRGHYLRERAEVVSAFKEAKHPIHQEVGDRIKACEQWNADNGGRYTESELLFAGYELKESTDQRNTYVHPLSGERLQVNKLEQLSPEARAALKAKKDSARDARRQERAKAQPSKGAGGSKQVVSSGKQKKGGKK
jgi:hypothetical protein